MDTNGAISGQIVQQDHSFQCWETLDALFYCLTPPNQFTHLYRYGSADSCQEARKKLVRCFELKLEALSNAEAAKDEFQAALQRRAQPSDHVWEFRSRDERGPLTTSAEAASQAADAQHPDLSNSDSGSQK
mmetsp:Transcript_27491/g.47451  ORF Transcript_27491/g.47451 Transcript_27491/m.47451 type:complete len:131 (+) Transcript_27491:107-499(+)|eukprot:CAMPEP_0196661188 /NCGR_PEP_ID=MMETSP1086-20130531/43113_1 /TAXON_ID=77921 /ORGANISM="Cyanoptyche  gloeocystis , Strain SAG4.97" /LENGTH=130 /DNA_ID=CAMNT_0041995969 /DNA_START=103 /DNA_END=495 /DNA_ORIENTATION=+